MLSARSTIADDEPVPAIYADLLADDVWEPVDVSAATPNFYWNDGGFLSAAPVEVASTFAGAISSTTVLDPWFQMRAVRVAPDFVIPTRHHNLRQLTIVIDGEIEVTSRSGHGSTHVEATEFWVCETGTAYSVRTGPHGATYVECWDGPMALVETYWHDDPHWTRK